MSSESQVTGHFLAQLRASGILDEESIDDAEWNLRLRDLDDVEAAREMIKANLITQYQAKQILKGRGRTLMINGYKILYRIGAGGMGEVFAAEELSSGWEVAFKVLNEDRRDDMGMVNRFQLEAEAGMKLAHPNLLRTFSLDTYMKGAVEMNYVVMELVKGVNLRELLSLTKSISVGQACDIISQSAVGLQEAHKRGLVHRDVKPENILIRSDGAVKVLDFGLALQDENDEEFMMAYIMGQRRLGTADYVAPEQIIDSYQVDQRADIYSLGCTLYFALTGKVPYPDESIRAKLHGHCKGKPKPITDFRDDVPERLLKIIAKMTTKHPEKRVESAGQVIELLGPYAERETIQFDYSKIIRARERLARKLALLKASQTGLTGRTRSPIIEPPEAEVETMVRDDTDVNEQNPGSGAS